MGDELTGMNVAQMTRMIGARAVSPSELVEAFLRRIEDADPSVAAFVTVDTARVRAQAKTRTDEVMRGHSRGPLHGIPFAVKDIIDVEGLPTAAGSRLRSNTAAAGDAACVARMCGAGGIVLGKTATYEFATGGPSFDLPWKPTRNPWNLDHAPGGSSTGSAAAVAAGMAPMALGSDTGGSVRVPASYCGVTGFKPTFGRLDLAGLLALAPTFDTLGVLSRTAEDAALWLQVMDGAGSRDRAAGSGPAALDASMRGIRIGLVRHLYDDAGEDLVAAINDAQSVFRALGATIVEASLSPLADYGACLRTIVAAEAFAMHRRNLAQSPASFGEVFRYRVLPGMLVQGSDYVAANWLRRSLADAALASLGEVDVLLTGTTLDTAPAFAAMSLSKRLKPFLTAPFSVAGLPAISLCAGFDGHGLPLSMQIVGKPYDDALVLRVAHAFQKETSWHTRQPVLDTARPAPTSRIPEWTPGETSDDPAVDSLIDTCLDQHGIRLSTIQRRQLREGADAILPMIARVRNHGIH